MATASFEQSEKEGASLIYDQIRTIQKKLVKIGHVDPKIICL